MKKIHFITLGAFIKLISSIIIPIIFNSNNLNTTMLSLMNNISATLNISSFVLIFIGIFKKEKNSKINSKKKLLVILAILLFIISLIMNISLALNNTGNFYDFAAFFIFAIIPTIMSSSSILAYIIIIYAVTLKNESVKNTKKEKNKKKKKWKTILSVSIIIFISAILYCLIVGKEWYIFLLYLWLPLLIASVVMIIISIIKVRQYK